MLVPAVFLYPSSTVYMYAGSFVILAKMNTLDILSILMTAILLLTLLGLFVLWNESLILVEVVR
jgi:hypothetical protein